MLEMQQPLQDQAVLHQILCPLGMLMALMPHISTVVHSLLDASTQACPVLLCWRLAVRNNVVDMSWCMTKHIQLALGLMTE